MSQVVGYSREVNLSTIRAVDLYRGDVFCRNLSLPIWGKVEDVLWLDNGGAAITYSRPPEYDRTDSLTWEPEPYDLVTVQWKRS